MAKLRELTRADSHVEQPACLGMVVDRERTIRSLAASFSRLPPGKRRRAPVPLAGNSVSDTYVVAEAHDGSQSAEGIVVDGARDESGQWDFDADFTIFTTDEELLVCHGYSCNVEIR